MISGKPSYQYHHNACALCGLKSSETPKKLMFCYKCRIVVYCSKEHQVAHWKQHKKFCRDHRWRKSSSQGIAAAASCSVTVCACKTWDILDSQTLPQSTSLVFPIQTTPSCTERVADGYDPPGSLNAYVLDAEVETQGLEVGSQHGLEPAMSAMLLDQHAGSFSSLDGRESSSSSAGLDYVSNQSASLLGPTSSVYTRPESLETPIPVSSSFETPQHHNLPQTDSDVVIAKNNEGWGREELADDNVTNSSTMSNSSTTIPFQHRNNMQPLTSQTSNQTRLWMVGVWKQVIEDLNRYGVCVVDNLLGDTRGASVLKEVQSLYSSGAFQDGQLVKELDIESKSIRGDKIKFVDGAEPNCKNIAVLVKILDSIVMGANNVSNNGILGTYKITERSKAMIACYPGSGTQYVKHVDNPNDDGRCITAIYYLNKDWNTKENGGLLRIFPEGWSHQVADIEPLFDRVIFFWSDRRNPHEVQPAYKTRYAITLWYFDYDARERAKLSSERNKQT